jgi:hypothetical protein
MRKNTEHEEINIVLKRFKMQSIPPNKILLFIGKRNTGKSVLAVDYLFYNQDVPFCTCISPTDDLNLTFRPHIPSRFIFDSYSPKLIENFVLRQKAITKKMINAKEGKGDPRYKNIDPRGILIMDDLLADAPRWKKDPYIQWIFMNGRHANITLILTMQYQMGIPPELRANADFIFICKEVKRAELDKLFKYYAGVFASFEMFRQVLDKVTRNYGCLVIDNTSNSDKLQDQVYVYRATLHDKNSFRICYKEFWVDNEDYITIDLDDNINGQPPIKNNNTYQSKFKINVNLEN